MQVTPIKERLTSPAEARAVPPAMAATAPTRSRRGFSSPAAKSAAVFLLLWFWVENECFSSFFFFISHFLLLSSNEKKRAKTTLSFSLLTHGHHGGERLEHLDERYGQEEVDDVAKVEGEGHEESH